MNIIAQYVLFAFISVAIWKLDIITAAVAPPPPESPPTELPCKPFDMVRCLNDTVLQNFAENSEDPCLKDAWCKYSTLKNDPSADKSKLSCALAEFEDKFNCLYADPAKLCKMKEGLVKAAGCVGVGLKNEDIQCPSTTK